MEFIDVFGILGILVGMVMGWMAGSVYFFTMRMYKTQIPDLEKRISNLSQFSLTQDVEIAKCCANYETLYNRTYLECKKIQDEISNLVNYNCAFNTSNNSVMLKLEDISETLNALENFSLQMYSQSETVVHRDVKYELENAIEEMLKSRFSKVKMNPPPKPKYDRSAHMKEIHRKKRQLALEKKS